MAIKKSTKKICWRRCDENVNWYNCYGEEQKVKKPTKNTKTELYVPPLLGIYPEKT